MMNWFSGDDVGVSSKIDLLLTFGDFEKEVVLRWEDGTGRFKMFRRTRRILIRGMVT